MSQLLEALRTRQPIGNLAAVAHYSAMAVEAAALKAPREWHGLNAGECANVLDTLPVWLRYEVTADRCGSDVCEVTDVLIAGHVLDAGNFDVSLCAEWGRQCLTARVAAGVL